MEEKMTVTAAGGRPMHFEGTEHELPHLMGMLAGIPGREAEDAGFVEHSGALYEKMTVDQYLKFFAGLTGTMGCLDSAIEQMHLSGLLKKKISRCTDGEKKRIRIAREIAKGAEDYFVFNPIAFEDEESKRIILGWMETFCDKNARLVTLSLSHRDTCICPGDHYEITADGIQCIDPEGEPGGKSGEPGAPADQQDFRLLS